MMNILKNTQGCIRDKLMKKHELIEKLRGGLIVSCQAYEDNPLFGTENMVTMAQCVLKGGASGLRACWPETIRAIRNITDVPIIGIHKVMEDTNFNIYDSIFITPTYEAAKEIIEAGCDIVAMDGTLRGRSEEELQALVTHIKREFPDILLMADLATIEEGIVCERVGFDILSSTLSGYTRETMHKESAGPDLELIRLLKEKTGCIINGEGRIWNLEHLNAVRDAGADMVTIGSAITNPMKTTAYLMEHMK